jgi:hypothetical protein
MVFGPWIQHAVWWPDLQLRLFRKGHVEWSDEIHSIPITSGKVSELPAVEKFALLHHNYQSIEQYLDRLNNYTNHEVPRHTYTADDFTPQEIISTFFDDWLRRLFAKRGIDGGTHGVSLSMLQGMYQLIVRLKAWEQRQNFAPHPTDQTALTAQLRQIQSDLNYWIADWRVEHSSGLAKIYWKIRRKLQI